MQKPFKVAQNPKDRRWYVVGHATGKYWMPVSDGYATRREAVKRIPLIRAAEISARREISV